MKFTMHIFRQYFGEEKNNIYAKLIRMKKAHEIVQRYALIIEVYRCRVEKQKGHHDKRITKCVCVK